MKDKGQFSIIAALLVAVVLIATVIITYSTIRNFPTGEQPQVLSAIDETNLALKQILGFTVGYYGSILQVTGERDYAYDSARKYLIGGLEYIARMHPEWAASFNLKNVDLEAYWFTSQSYSRGNITVEYNLTGVGIYGIRYTTSCKLSVNILGTEENKAHIRVTADEKDEPVINLGKNNFKFYLYRYTNSTWAMTSPGTEPTALADGTYIIDIPSGVDPYSYVVQVEDPRGIVAVASSFSRYTITLTWNSTMYSLTGAVIVTKNEALINHESFEGSWPPSGGWTRTGRWNKENDRAYNGAYSADFDGPQGQGQSESGYLTTPGLNCYGANSIYVDFWYRDEQCDTGDFLLQYYDGTTWTTAADLGAAFTENQWLHYQQVITDNQYFKSNFAIRWYAHLERDEHAYVDYVTVTVSKNVIVRGEIQPVIVEVLQNGTMRWLGEHLELTTQAKPIPPIPVKAIHVNQTINDVNREVPFQIEDWASDYRVPLGLANNASVFNNRNMLVFLVNPNVSKVTIWWDGSDRAVQTPLAYTNRHFSYTFGDQYHPITISNEILNLAIDFSGDGSFKAISTLGSSQANAVLMRINQDTAHYGHSRPMYAVLNGIVRAVLHHEVEWPSGGISGCPNVYAHIVLMLPANATYYTYQLRLMFINSSRPRTITDLCPIKLSFSGGQPKTENGTANGYPIVSNATGLFYNFSATCWQHHWSQLNSSLTKGAGIIFTDAANQMLYRFDAIAGSKTGALNAALETIELCPVTNMASVTFQYPLDLIWYGAVVTFDETTPILKPDGGGLWIIAEYPPTVTVTTES